MTKKKVNVRRKLMSNTTGNPSLGKLAEQVDSLLAEYEQFDADGKVNGNNRDYWKNAHDLLVSLQKDLKRPKAFCLQWPMDLPD